jgi:hypothetical protein
MQPWEKTLTDQKISDVLTYVRQEWGNTGGPVIEAISRASKELAGAPSRGRNTTFWLFRLMPGWRRQAAPAATAKSKPAASPPHLRGRKFASLGCASRYSAVAKSSRR